MSAGITKTRVAMVVQRGDTLARRPAPRHEVGVERVVPLEARLGLAPQRRVQLDHHRHALVVKVLVGDR